MKVCLPEPYDYHYEGMQYSGDYGDYLRKDEVVKLLEDAGIEWEDFTEEDK